MIVFLARPMRAHDPVRYFGGGRVFPESLPDRDRHEICAFERFTDRDSDLAIFDPELVGKLGFEVDDEQPHADLSVVIHVDELFGPLDYVLTSRLRVTCASVRTSARAPQSRACETNVNLRAASHRAVTPRLHLEHAEFAIHDRDHIQVLPATIAGHSRATESDDRVSAGLENSRDSLLSEVSDLRRGQSVSNGCAHNDPPLKSRIALAAS
jgi:hypothetical protein